METKWKIAYRRRKPTVRVNEGLGNERIVGGQLRTSCPLTTEYSDDIFSMGGLKVWETPKGQYEADPFLLKRRDTNYLFYELYDYKKGVIAYSTITDKGISEPTVCLEEPFHLSYPCVFEDKGQVYMVPEMGASKKIILYKATGFPKKWEPVNTILDDLWTEDNNTFFYKGLWWLTTSQSGNTLLIMKTKELEGKWKKHIITRSRNCRGAGGVFEHDGMLVRPTQESEKEYGRAVIFNEIELPSYSGEAFDRIEPDFLPDIKGVHTFNFNEDYVVVDCKTKV